MLVLDKLELKKNAVAFSLPLFAPVNFCSVRNVLLPNLAFAAQTTPSCSDMFTNFSQKVLMLPL